MSRRSRRVLGRPFCRRSHKGQALVEFALTFLLFILLVMGVLDFGRGIFMWNGVSEAAREIARVTSVHPGATLGDSIETQQVVDNQKALFFDISDPTFTCVDITGAIVPGTCRSGDYVRVAVSGSFVPATPPLLFFIGHLQLSSSSSVEIP